MKIYTSYFYAVRFLKPWQIPFSTACWDPKWFHAFKGPSHVFLDKRGVVNGLRAEKLHPDETCAGICNGRPCDRDFLDCLFLKRYKQQLLKLDAKAYKESLELAAAKVCSAFHIDCKMPPEIILVVHEAPGNLCSERGALQEVLKCKELDISKLQDVI